MAEYIDRENLLDMMLKGKAIGTLSANQAIRLVKQAEIEDAAPVVHGRWLVVDVSPEYERENGKLKIVDNTIEEQCELCGMRTFRYATEETWKYCPNCGARMDKGVQDG